MAGICDPKETQAFELERQKNIARIAAEMRKLQILSLAAQICTSPSTTPARKSMAPRAPKNYDPSRRSERRVLAHFSISGFRSLGGGNASCDGLPELQEPGTPMLARPPRERRCPRFGLGSC